MPASKLRRLVLKELADNALDTGASVSVGELPERRLLRRGRRPRHRRHAGGDRPPVQHRPADGLDQAAAAADARRARQRPAGGRRCACWRRTASSSSSPATGGSSLRPERDGTTTVVSVKPVEFPVGTRIEIGFGPAMPEDADALHWAQRGHASWRDGHDLRRQVVAVVVRRAAVPRAAVGQRRRAGARAGRAASTAAPAGRRARSSPQAGLGRMACTDVSREQADTLLEVAREHARPVSPKRLGAVGPDAIPGLRLCHRRAARCRSARRAAAPRSRSWSRRGPSKTSDDMQLLVCVNRTPVTGDIEAARDKRDIDAVRLRACATPSPRRRRTRTSASGSTSRRPTCRSRRTARSRTSNRSSTRSANAVGKAVQQGAAPRRQAARRRRTSCSTISTRPSPTSAATESYRFNERQLFYCAAPHRHGRDRQGTEDRQLHRASSPTTRPSTARSRCMYREPRGSIYPSAPRRDHHARHADGRGVRAPGMDLQQAALHREGGRAGGAEAGRAGWSGTTAR